MNICQHPFTDRHAETRISGRRLSDLFPVLVFQIVQTRILSVIAWYYLAFFAISVAMLGMTIGRGLGLCAARAVSSRIISQATCRFDSLVTAFTSGFDDGAVQPDHYAGADVTTLVSWRLLLAAMTVPYVFAGVVVSLALTRSPFPVNQVYGVDLLGAAPGLCGGGAGAERTGWAHHGDRHRPRPRRWPRSLRSASPAANDQPHSRARRWLGRNPSLISVLLVLDAVNALLRLGFGPSWSRTARTLRPESL